MHILDFSTLNLFKIGLGGTPQAIKRELFPGLLKDEAEEERESSTKYRPKETR